MSVDSSDERIFIDGTLARVSNLIRRGIWEGVDWARVKAWYRQFEERERELLGACLLDNLVYCSKQQYIALLKATMTCPQLLGGTPNADDWFIVRRLSGGADPRIRLAPVISFNLPPTKSGTYVLRLLARALRVRDDWMIWPETLAEMQNPIDMVLLVDDFCGSGDQFLEFADRIGLKQFVSARPKCRVIYLVTVAHATGVAAIRCAIPEIEVIVADELTADHHFFSGTVLDQYGIPDLKDRLKEEYEDLCESNGIGGRVGHYGYGECGICYAFSHATPNNTLPIYWYNSAHWSSLLDR